MVDVVLDTNVIVAGLLSRRGASFQLLQLLGTGRFRPHISVELALEYEEVLSRDVLDSGLRPADLGVFLDYLFSVSVLVGSVAVLRPRLRDPDDEFVLELAAQRSAVVVRFNKRHVQLRETFLEHRTLAFL